MGFGVENSPGWFVLEGKMSIFFQRSSVWVMLWLLIAGCSKTPDAKTSENESPSFDDSPAPEQNANKLSTNLFEMMKLADQQNSEGDFDTAYETWRNIHSQVNNEYGIDAWQTVSAELAMNAARQRTKMTAENADLSRQLTQLVSNSMQLMQEKKYDSARPDIEKASGLSTRLWGKESFVSANINFNRAMCYFYEGDHNRAIAVMTDVLNLRISLTGVNHPDVETAMESLATAHNRLKQFDQEEKVLIQLLDVSKSLWGIESREYEIRCNDLGVAYNNNSKPLLAIKQFNELVELRRKKYGDDSMEIGHAEFNRGIAFSQIKKYDAALTSLQTTYSIFHKHDINLQDLSWVTLLEQLGQLSLITKKHLDGQRYYSELADLWKANKGDGSIEYGKSLYKLSVCIGNQGKYPEAEPIMKRSLDIFEANLGAENKLLHQPLTTYSWLLEKMGVTQEAERVKIRAVRLAGFQPLPK
ncbi:tetratricopeptide repeat protein [bacterium]|nr:tetratricopeptide repeat protein [bacterium]